MKIKELSKKVGKCLVVVSLIGAAHSGMNYFFINNRVIKDGDITATYKADLPFGYTKLIEGEKFSDKIVEKFGFANRHILTWWDIPETDYLDAFYDWNRWYSHGQNDKDDAVLAKEKKNLEEQLERFKIEK